MKKYIFLLVLALVSITSPTFAEKAQAEKVEASEIVKPTLTMEQLAEVKRLVDGEISFDEMVFVEIVEEAKNVIEVTPKQIDSQEDFDAWVLVVSAVLLLLFTYGSHLIPAFKDITDTQKRALAMSGAVLITAIIVLPIVKGELRFQDVITTVVGEVLTLITIYPVIFSRIAKTKDLSEKE